ncbi:LysR family transcriptional regulator [Undibacterium umbellatum]|uniref:LysR family transcriptional regulator n=1 Tax=Undibacterium umbellatum TaxID=2762300 RepID=A0ABR6ZH53_9BURK|nr:LysR family transcriptional regulator [Undibacterium umbellatum]MBC3911023.1 LysR family transcriptional regulator [Undibacterium umbellatum]
MFDAIQIFLEVHEAGSLSAVAKKHNVAVSSISRKIDALESELGIKLFHRSSRRLLLTDTGEQFLPRAKNIAAELDDARQAMSDLNGDPRGLLTVTAPSAFGRRHVAPAVASFLNRYPLMEVDLHVSDEIVDLSTRRVDVAVRIGVLPDSDLVASTLAPLHRLTCASPAYLARHGRPATPQDLLKHDCLTIATPPIPAGWWCYPGVNRELSLPVRGSLRSDDTESLLHAALAGIGIVHLASWMACDAIESGQLISLFPSINHTHTRIRPGIHAVRMPGRSHAAKAQLFIAHLRSTFGEPPYWDRILHKSA